MQSSITANKPTRQFFLQAGCLSYHQTNIVKALNNAKKTEVNVLVHVIFHVISEMASEALTLPTTSESTTTAS